MAIQGTASATAAVLPEQVKQSIQEAYKQLLAHYNFTPRFGQRKMIADIANSLAVIGYGAADRSDPLGADGDAVPAPICVVEAGTGTGKTLAYLLSVIPVAALLDRKVVLATATVALQEQVVTKDLPDILAGCDLQFSFAMAKGRGRYLCLSRLDALLQRNDSLDALFDLFGESPLADAEDNRSLYQSMLEEVGKGTWEGDRDEWREPLTDGVWAPVTVDNTQCIGSRCTYFRQCCFFKARQALDKADLIVANHDLVLADLALGGGAILPVPEETIYVFDEAHHLPQKSNNHFSAFTRIRRSIGWIQQSDRALARLSAETHLAAPVAQRLDLEALRKNLARLEASLNESWLLLEQIADSSEETDAYGGARQHTFTLGVVPAEIRELAGLLEVQYSRVLDQLLELRDMLGKLAEQAPDLPLRAQAEQWYPLVGSMYGRTEGCLALWASFSRQDQGAGAPTARWLSVTEAGGATDIALASSPVLAAENLTQRLWRRCSGAVLTSATLSALGRFDVLRMRAGLPEHARYVRIPSPFDFTANAVLAVPRMNCEPSDTERHTGILVQSLPRVIHDQEAALVLFSSRRQMQDVIERLDPGWRERVLSQDDYQKSQLLKFHRQRVDRGESSVIFGLASFAEGIDLPGSYCTHVVIAKIPFAVPNDPIEATLSQWVESRGENAFMTLAVPEAAFRLVQACGRLLRNEADQGRITIFDERLVTRFYGKTILDSLPPYRREIFQQDFSRPA